MRKHHITLFFIISTAALLFVPFTGRVHLFDWDEANFAEAAREMITTGDYLTVQINYIPFHEKPPFFIWMQALSMKMFGINEFAARFPNAVCGMITLCFLYIMGNVFVNRRFALLWVMAYAGSILPFFYFKSGIIDPWFNLFIFTGLCFYIRATLTRPLLNMVFSGFLIGLAVLTKGPVGLLLFALTVLSVSFFQRFRKIPHFSAWTMFCTVFILTGGSWYIIQWIAGHQQLIVENIRYHLRLLNTGDAGHSGFPLYHPVVLFLGVFPASVLALAGWSKETGRRFPASEIRLWMTALFLVVLVVFSVVKTKIVHYSSLCYFPLSFMAAAYMYVLYDNYPMKKWVAFTLILTALLISLAVYSVPWAAQHSQSLFRSGILADPFAAANLKANVQWTGFEWAFCLLYFFVAVYSVRMIFTSRHGLIALFSVNTIFTYFLILFFVPRIEAISQAAAIDFYKHHQTPGAYLTTYGFKSYAFLFYSQKPPSPPYTADKEWLLTAPLDKPAYFVTKITKKDIFLSRYPDVRFLYDKNGYAFFVRNPAATID